MAVPRPRGFMPRRIILPLLVRRMAYSWRPGFPIRVFFDTKPAACRRLVKHPEPWVDGVRLETAQFEPARLKLAGSNWHRLNRYGSEPHGLDIARIAAAGGAEMSLVQFG